MILLLLVNLDMPQAIESMASTAVVWANLAYLFVTLPLLWNRPRRVDELSGKHEYDRSEHVGFRLGRFRTAISASAVAFGTMLIVNIGWPRPEIYGEGAIGRFGAAPATCAMLGVGLLYDRLVRSRRGGVLEEHKV